MFNVQALVRENGQNALGAALAGAGLDQLGRRTGKVAPAAVPTKNQWIWGIGAPALAGVLIQSFAPRYSEIGGGFIAAAGFQAGGGLSALASKPAGTSTGRVGNVVPMRRVAGGQVSPPSV